MASKKNEEEEEILDKEEDEDDLDESGDDSGKSASKEDDDKEIEVEIEEEKDEKEEKDERIAVQGRKSVKEESQEEKRARRRRERQLKRNRDYANRRELESAKQLIANLTKRLEGLEGAAGEFGKREASRDEQQIETAINSQKSLYAAAEKQFTSAIAEGNGAAAAEAQRVMMDASNKFNQLTQLKATSETQRRTQAETVTKPSQTSETANETALKATYTNRWLAKNDWFDPAGSDEDSKLAKEIDSEVSRDGFNPSTREYWDELNTRLKEELPHVFGERKAERRASAVPRPKQVNGSLGADSTPSNVKTVKIPERVVKMAKDAGFWDDPKMRKTFINNWKSQNGMVN